MQWQAVISSARGIKHKKIGKPCQDWGAYQILSKGHVLIGAVSDGMGSAQHAEIGSQLAVEVVISELQQDYWQSQLISCSVDHLHFSGNKAGGRRQEAGGKKEGCKVSGNYNCLSELDITDKNAV
ncbi:MAG: protein phosphatase 2C domain-containing protein, partial [Symploca sp. SIO2E6]|nr:protein phosphatase 2C domain-containing protein [Symploca sp. SIO2E6]